MAHGPPPTPPIRRDVSSTLDEFVRTLRQAFPRSLSETPPHYRAHGGTRFGDAAIDLELHPGAPRRIAGIALPTLDVTIRHAAGGGDDFIALLAYLDRYLHKGGG